MSSPGDSNSFPILPSTPPSAACWAVMSLPPRGRFFGGPFHRRITKRVLTQTLKRWAKIFRPSGGWVVGQEVGEMTSAGQHQR